MELHEKIAHYREAKRSMPLEEPEMDKLATLTYMRALLNLLPAAADDDQFKHGLKERAQLQGACDLEAGKVEAW